MINCTKDFSLIFLHILRKNTRRIIERKYPLRETDFHHIFSRRFSFKWICWFYVVIIWGDLFWWSYFTSFFQKICFCKFMIGFLFIQMLFRGFVLKSNLRIFLKNCFTDFFSREFLQIIALSWIFFWMFFRGFSFEYSF